MGGTDYAKVHAVWTIPPAILLTLTFRRILTRRDVLKTIVLMVIAFISTTPWDSYLIRHKIWSYPPTSVFGPTFFDIPIEEGFFFIIQTYITAIIYALLSKTVVHAAYLPSNREQGRIARFAGVAFFVALFAYSLGQIRAGGPGSYLSLILAWVSPFLALLWFVASTSIVALPYTVTLLPIALPTMYLWICDCLALRRGTWVIETGTKLGIDFCGLEIEFVHLCPVTNWKLMIPDREAIFFFLTNTLVVFGLIACDYSLAIHDLYPERFPLKTSSSFPSFTQVLSSCMYRPTTEELALPLHLRNAISLTREKSKSFYIASMCFEGRLRIDLLSLYAWCRTCDDMIDEDSEVEGIKTRRRSASKQASLNLIRAGLDAAFTPSAKQLSPANELANLESRHQSAFHLVSTLPIPRDPLDELIDGFLTDLKFKAGEMPIQTKEDLERYANNVASSVAELCVRLVWAHEGYGQAADAKSRQAIVKAARQMGVALQLINIARDVPADLQEGRMYLPGRSLDTPIAALTEDRQALLDVATELARKAKPAIEGLPATTRGGIRAACDVYLDIGNAVDKYIQEGRIRERATVSKSRRISKAWTALA